MKHKGTEWSGHLFYKPVSGNIKKPETFVLEVTEMHLMDVGTSGGTSFENNERIVEIYDKNPELMKQRCGLIHSHHNMTSFFSGTDMSELNTNTEGVDYTLSLIVSTDMKWAAKLAMRGKAETRSKVSIPSGKKEIILLDKVTEQALITIDLDIELPESVQSVQQEDYTASRSNYWADNDRKNKKGKKEFTPTPEVYRYGILGHYGGSKSVYSELEHLAKQDPLVMTSRIERHLRDYLRTRTDVSTLDIWETAAGLLPGVAKWLDEMYGHTQDAKKIIKALKDYEHKYDTDNTYWD